MSDRLWRIEELPSFSVVRVSQSSAVCISLLTDIRRFGFSHVVSWSSGAFTANLPQVLRLFDASPEHDVVVFCRDTSEDAAFDTPDLVRTYLDLFTHAAEQSRKPYYLLHTRPGIMDWQLVAQLRTRGIAVVGGLREGLSAIDRVARFASRTNS